MGSECHVEVQKDKQIAKNTLSLFPHQERAVSLWLRTGCSLLMEMATGTGKTRTAIGCLLEILKRKEPLLIIVATPQNTLSRQWQADFNHLHISVDKEEIIDGSNHSWRKDLELIMLDLNDRMINSAVILQPTILLLPTNSLTLSAGTSLGQRSCLSVMRFMQLVRKTSVRHCLMNMSTEWDSALLRNVCLMIMALLLSAIILVRNRLNSP